MTSASRDLSFLLSRRISVIRVVNSLVMDPILKPVSGPGAPLLGSDVCVCMHM